MRCIASERAPNEMFLPLLEAALGPVPNGKGLPGPLFDPRARTCTYRVRHSARHFKFMANVCGSSGCRILTFNQFISDSLPSSQALQTFS